VGVAWVTWPKFQVLGPPNNFWTNRDIRFKFGTDIWDGPSLRTDYKTTPKWAWLGSRVSRSAPADGRVGLAQGQLFPARAVRRAPEHLYVLSGSRANLRRVRWRGGCRPTGCCRMRVERSSYALQWEPEPEPRTGAEASEPASYSWSRKPATALVNIVVTQRMMFIFIITYIHRQSAGE